MQGNAIPNVLSIVPNPLMAFYNVNAQTLRCRKGHWLVSFLQFHVGTFLTVTYSLTSPLTSSYVHVIKCYSIAQYTASQSFLRGSILFKEPMLCYLLL